MSYEKVTCECGKVIDVCKRHTTKHKKPGMKRQPKTQQTSEAQAKVNERQAARKLTRTLNLNFTRGDIHYCLTYDNEYLPKDVKEAKRNIDNFLRRAKRSYSKQGLEFKYVCVTEYSTQRTNHHLVIPASDTRILDDLWGMGFTRTVYLDNSGQYKELAEYLLKETRKTFRSENRISGKRWNGSKNLLKPEPIKEVIHAGSWVKEPKPLPGYYIAEVFNGISEITGYPYQYYTMIKLEEPRRKGAGT